jgi:imidazolonepropionase-like amidohydrolase
MRKLICAVALLFAAAVRGDAPSVFAIVGGTVHRVSAPDLEGGTVIVRGGVIEAVGTNVPLPPDATVIDAKGLHVYPGLIDAQTKLGITTPSPGSQPQPRPLTPSSKASDLLNLSDDTRLEKRTTGVTTVLIAASGEVFNGQSVLLNLGDRPLADSIIKQPATFQIGFATKNWGTFPDSLMGAIYLVRQTFLDAQRQRTAREIYERDPSGKERPSEDPDLAALSSAFDRRVPVAFAADNAEMIQRVLKLGSETGVRTIVVGARNGYEIADLLQRQKVDVFVSVDFPKAPATDRDEEPLRLIRARLAAPTTPAELAKRGVRFALVSNGAATGDFTAGIRKAIANGLSNSDALRAVTLAPAQILGVDRQLGSIDAGKIANLVITDREIFDRDRKIVQLLVDGRQVTLKSEEAKASTSESPVIGTWNIQVRMNNAVMNVAVTFRGTETELNGSFSGDRGAGELAKASVADKTIRFSFVAKTTESGETSEWSFEGTIEGNEMKGNVTTSLGTFPFTGSKPQ